MTRKIESRRWSNPSTEIITYSDRNTKSRQYFEFSLNNLSHNKYTLAQIGGMIFFVPRSPIKLGWSITILRQWLFEDEVWRDSEPASNPSKNIAITNDYILIFHNDGRISFKLKNSNNPLDASEKLLKCLKEF